MAFKSPAGNDLRSLIWQGFIPAVISLATSDITSVSAPNDVYIMLPRMSYLAVAAADCIQHFREYTCLIDTQIDCIWFDHDSCPLKSHLPIGNLFDSYSSNSNLPWRICVHFSGLPAQLITSGSPEIMEHRYFHALKQAVFLLYGNTRYFTTLSLQQHDDLWTGIRQSNCELFCSISEHLLPSIDRGPVKNIPIRCIVVSKTNGSVAIVQRAVKVFSNKYKVEEEPSEIKASSEGIESTTTNPIDGENILEQPVSTANTKEVNKFAETLGDAIKIIIFPKDEKSDANTQEKMAQIFCKIQGVGIPFDAPLLELWRTFAYPDLFLYVTLRL